VNPEYININKRRMSPTGLRMLTMMTGKATLQLPKKFTDDRFYKLPRAPEFREWLKRGRVRYYLEQPTDSPWRVWHFRMPWLQRYKTGEEPVDLGSGWQLYRCDGRQIPVHVAVPELAPSEYPTRVPGL